MTKDDKDFLVCVALIFLFSIVFWIMWSIDDLSAYVSFPSLRHLIGFLSWLCLGVSAFGLVAFLVLKAMGKNVE